MALELTQADLQSETWRKIKDYYTARLLVYRRQNDTKMAEADRNYLIGKIQEVKDVLALESHE